jgi:outer membrane protein TolC
VRRDAAAIARGEQALVLARREQRPDFGIRLATQKGTGGMPWMYGLELMVSVPVFWNRKQQPRIVEAAAALDGVSRVREQTVIDVVAAAAQEHAALDASRALIDLYGDSVLPQARLTLESSMAAYEVGAVDFLTLLTNFIAVLNYEVSLEEQRARAWQALARLEPLTGLTLLR